MLRKSGKLKRDGGISVRKKMWLFHFAYYVLSLFVYVGFLLVSSKLLHTTNLGAAIAATYGILFFATPIVVVVLMRFSLLKWYVDPIAAAEVPLFLYFGMILKQMSRSEVDFHAAFLKINGQLSADGGEGWLFLTGLFVFGLAASFSFARKKEESISYRLLGKFTA